LHQHAQARTHRGGATHRREGVLREMAEIPYQIVPVVSRMRVRHCGENNESGR
jgi:hypothetical protein